MLKQRFECECITIVTPDKLIPGHSGLYAFIRVKDGVPLEAVVAVESEDYPVMPSMVSYVCRSLGIDDTRDLTHSH